MERLSYLYASALFDLAVEHNAVQDFHDQAEFLHATLRDDKCVELLLHPHISTSVKQEFFKTSFAGYIHVDLLNFLFLTADKNREAFILPALEALIESIDRYNNKVTARVRAAVPLDDDQAGELSTLLKEMLNKTVVLSVEVDPSIIGGPYIFVDGYYIDWTLKKRMRDLTVHMKEGCSA